MAINMSASLCFTFCVFRYLSLFLLHTTYLSFDKSALLEEGDFATLIANRLTTHCT